MCRSANHLHPSPLTHDDDVLTIKALFVHVRPSDSGFSQHLLPQFLTLLFHPPNPPLSLHRLLNHPLPHIIFAAKLCRALRLRPSQQPLSFQLFLEESMLVLNGAFVRKDHHHWMLDCKSQLHHLQSHSVPISEVQLCFAFDDGKFAVTNWVRLINPKERIKHCVNVCHLEKIPEEMEMEVPSEDSQELMDLERLRWGVDLGIWVLCLGLGVGYLVSRASVRKFRPF